MKSNRTYTALFAVLSALALVISLTAPSSADKKEDELNKRKRDLSGKIGDAKADAQHSSKELVQAQSALKKAKSALSAARVTLSETRGALAVAQARDAQMQTKLNRAEASLVAAVKQLQQGEVDLVDAEQVVADFTVQSLQDGDSGLKAFNGLLDGESPNNFTEEMSINDSVGEAQVARMQQLDAARVVLKLKRDDVKDLRDRVRVARADAAANLATQRVLEAEASAQTAKVSQLVSARSKAEGQADRAAQADLALLRELEEDRARVESRIAALAARDVRTGGRGVGGDRRGGLTLSVNGPITSPYGMRVHPITGVYKLHDGTDFAAPCGAPVRAPASGTIIEQYYNSAYGNRIILNNGVKRGKSIITTFNHLSRWRFPVGKRVTRGQVIGYAGTTGMSTGCHLHLMVLANGRTTNPMSWM